MSQWARENPELYEEVGHDGMADHFHERADRQDWQCCANCGARYLGIDCRLCGEQAEEDRRELARERRMEQEQSENYKRLERR